MEKQNMILYGTTGALLLFGIYHTQLYWGRKEKLLLHYCIYIYSCIAAVVLGILVSAGHSVPGSLLNTFSLVVSFLSYSFYFWFIATALGITRIAHYRNWFLIRVVQLLIYLYIALMIFSCLYRGNLHFLDQVASAITGVTMVSIGTYIAIYYFRKDKKAFTRLLLLGSLSQATLNTALCSHRRYLEESHL